MGMQESKPQIIALLEALLNAGFTAEPDFKDGAIVLKSFPEFKEKPAFYLAIMMDDPRSVDFEGVYAGCRLESGRIVKGAAHDSRIYSRKTAVERAKQEKWAASWMLYDAGIIPPDEKPSWDEWQDVVLP